MSSFDDTTGWRLVRPVEIREPAREVNGKLKEFALYLHPQRFHLDLENVVVRSAFRWREVFTKEDGHAGRLERDRSDHRRYLTATATLGHRVHVFKVGGPKVAAWDDREVLVELYPDDRGEAATWARDVDRMGGEHLPDEGILGGESGRLTYFGSHEPAAWHERDQPAQMIVTLHAPAADLNALLEDLIQSPRRARAIRASIEAELFEGEMEAFFADQTPRRDFGLLVRGDRDDHASTRARLDHLIAEFEPVVPLAVGTDQENGGKGGRQPEIMDLAVDPSAVLAKAVASSSDRLAGTVRRSAWGLGILIILAALWVGS